MSPVWATTDPQCSHLFPRRTSHLVLWERVIVFPLLSRTEKGFEFLPQKNVDFGGGLERMMMAVHNTRDIFTIDAFDGMRQVLELLSGRVYGDSPADTKAYRVILDHIRAATFVIADGAYPSNKDQGYFVRRLMRRSIRFAQGLGITTNFCAEVANAVLRTYQDVYPELKQNQENIITQMQKEEEKFRKTLATGLHKFEDIIMGKSTGEGLTSDEAFDLYQSYGFPLEITEELVKEKGLTLDVDGFRQKLKEHQDLSRQGSEKKFKGGLADHSDMSIKYHTATHLLHIALRKVLGPHVGQKGSNITPERLRFDFSHPDKMTDEQIKQVEDLVNAAIVRDYPVSWQEMPVADAYKDGVIGLFPDRYDDIIKVYTIGDPKFPGNADPSEPTFSREICGGPHVEHTGVIGHFKITKEEACSAGVRRPLPSARLFEILNAARLNCSPIEN
jgi:alanyl-tRNA synthetase